MDDDTLLHSPDDEQDLGALRRETWTERHARWDSEYGPPEEEFDEFTRSTLWGIYRHKDARRGIPPIKGADAAADRVRVPPIQKESGRDQFVPTMAEFLALNMADPEWVVDGLFAAGSLNALVSLPDIGKTTMTSTLAICVVRGWSFVGRDVKPGPVFLGQFEEIPVRGRERLVRMGATAEDRIFPFIGPCPPDLADSLEAWIKQERPALVILDTLGKVFPDTDLNDYSQVNRAMTPYINMARAYNVAMLFTHHAKKTDTGTLGGNMLGSTALKGNADTTMEMRLKDGKRIIYSEQRYGEAMPETVLTLEPDTGRVVASGTVAQERARQIEDDVLDALIRKGTPMSQTAVIQSSGRKAKAVRFTLGRLCDDGRVRSYSMGNAIMYEIVSERIASHPSL